MHEVSLVRELVRLVELQCDQHGYRQVKEIHLQLGVYSCVAPEALRFAFDSVRSGRLENTQLKIRQVESRSSCSICGYQEKLSEAYVACARCGGMMMPQEFEGMQPGEMRVTQLEVI
jgi:hydrogenase nickel incorporation protein HypA/HybF